MKILWKRGRVIIDPPSSFLSRIFALVWWGIQPASVRTTRGGAPWTLTLLNRRNLAVWIILLGWGLYYFTHQFHSSQEPYYGDGPLFTAAPTLFLQEHRHILLDYFLSYGWVMIFILVGSFYFLLAITSERGFWRYGLAFWATWITQYALQMMVNLASPMRNPDLDIAFIREEVFPWSENLVGLKYGAFPSGHIGVSLLVFMIARERGAPWVRKLTLASLIIMFWSIIYLGEHYVIDAVASAVLYPAIYLLVTRKVFPAKRRPETAGADGTVADSGGE